MLYRPDIDGLRAIAVLFVVLNHANLLPGGYIGVDIFFVISGFLITNIIYKDIKNKEFLLSNFYMRRIRRIVPATTFVMIISLVPAVFIMLPDPLENYGQSLVATALFSNNVLLWLTTGYWDLASEFKPLLHTWSLGIEEQYYAIAPIVMLLFCRSYSASLCVFILITVTSFVYCIYATFQDHDMAYYLLPSRAWQISIGGVIALLFLKFPFWNARFLTPLGMFIIFSCALTFRETTSYPGFLAVMPVLGACFILGSNDTNTSGKGLLVLPPLVLLGKLSFSLYLLHQPFYAYIRIFAQDEPSSYVYLFLLPVIVLLSYFMWRCIEEPFRSYGRYSNKQIILIFLPLNIVIVSFGLFLHFSEGRFLGVNKHISNNNIAFNEEAFELTKDKFIEPRASHIAVFGDSYARDFVNILGELKNENIEIIYIPQNDVCRARLDYGESIVEVADTVIFANLSYDENCISEVLNKLRHRIDSTFVVIPKGFGSNLNWVRRFELSDRRLLSNTARPELLTQRNQIKSLIPEANLIDLQPNLESKPNAIITDRDGRLITFDRYHLTQAGAKYLALQIQTYDNYQCIIGAKLCAE